MVLSETFDEYAEESASEKIGLAVVEAAKRLVGWSEYVLPIYKIEDFDIQVISRLTEEGIDLVEGTNQNLLTPGQFYFDRENSVLYCRASDDSNPNGRFIALVFKNFYSTPSGIVALPHDLNEGFAVEWLPLLKDTSDFGVELDNQNQLGQAIEGSGSMKLINDREYWNPRFDKLYFENQKVELYSWTRTLPATEAKLLFRGFVVERNYSEAAIDFKLKDNLNALRAPVALAALGAFPGARVKPSQQTAKQRRIYGRAYGVVPAPIDQVLIGYQLVGTVNVVRDSAAIEGIGTEFLRQVSPDDKLLFVSPVGTTDYTVESITDDLNLTLTSEYGSRSQNGVGVYIKPANPKRYTNRRHLIAGHALREPSTTISAVFSQNTFSVVDPLDFNVGDLINVGTEVASILRISGNRFRLAQNLLDVPTVGTTVQKDAISNVRIGGLLMQADRDYTYDPNSGEFFLEELAEFNVAPVVKIPGSVEFTNGSLDVTGVGTSFTSLKTGDWIRGVGQADFFEIGSIIDDLNLKLRTPATYDYGPGPCRAKRPDYFNEMGGTVIQMDVLGITEDGTPSGKLIATAPGVLKHLLTSAGLGSILDTDTFDDAEELVSAPIGFPIPKKFDTREADKLRDVMNAVNQSVFGSVVQTAEFKLRFSYLRPQKQRGLPVLQEDDMLKWQIASTSSRIVKTTRVRYRQQEWDYLSNSATSEEVTKVSKSAAYLANNQNEKIVECVLVDQADAEMLANRWSFILESASSTITISSKLRGMLISVTDKLELRHEKFYQRVGSTLQRKIAAVQSSKKSYDSTAVQFEDLSNAFSRCGVICEDGVPNFDNSSEEELLYHSFVTDDYGMIDNDPETMGVNLIW